MKMETYICAAIDSLNRTGLGEVFQDLLMLRRVLMAQYPIKQSLKNARLMYEHFRWTHALT